MAHSEPKVDSIQAQPSLIINSAQLCSNAFGSVRRLCDACRPRFGVSCTARHWPLSFPWKGNTPSHISLCNLSQPHRNDPSNTAFAICFAALTGSTSSIPRHAPNNFHALIQFPSVLTHANVRVSARKSGSTARRFRRRASIGCLPPCCKPSPSDVTAMRARFRSPPLDNVTLAFVSLCTVRNNVRNAERPRTAAPNPKWKYCIAVGIVSTTHYWTHPVEGEAHPLRNTVVAETLTLPSRPVALTLRTG